MYETERYLAHHGIKGQKWGVRRFQNPDGTRTSAGKRREKAARKEVAHEKLIRSTNAKELYKHRDQLSDKELQDRLNRLRNEQALEQMANARANNGKRVAKQILADSGKEALKESVKGAMKPVVGAAVTAGATWVANKGIQKLIATVTLTMLLHRKIKFQ